MKPMVLLSNARNQCLTFCWPGDLRFYVGYRAIEHNPRILPAALAGIDEQPGCTMGDWPAPASEPADAGQAGGLNPNWSTSFTETQPQDPIQFAFQAYSDGSAWCRGQDNQGAQTRELFFQPVEDGVWMWMRLTTREDIYGAFGVQQCLRFTGGYNEAWRQNVAHVPYLSELDLQAMGQADTTLTSVRRDRTWFNLPVAHSAYATPPGRPLLGEQPSFPQPLSPNFGGKGGGKEAWLDHGLIVRETVERNVAPPWYWERVAPDTAWQRIAAGMYWERSAAISNRHPADCVHAVVDFGPLAAGESRTVRGKFYYLEGTKEELLERWKRDFPIHNQEI